MDDKRKTEARLRAVYEESTRCAEAYRALSHCRFDTVYPLVFGYVRGRFLLEPEMCASEKLLDLADVSLRRLLALRRAGIDAGEIARSCAGASSVITKKILLMKALQEDFSVSMTPEQFADISTVTELTEFILTHGNHPGPAHPASEDAATDSFAGVRRDYPALCETVNGHPLIYLDNAAMAQMPLPVMEAMRAAECFRGGVRRGVHAAGWRSTDLYEETRRVCADFLGAAPEQITFTSGATDGVGRVASALRTMTGGVVTTALEHHSNFVPWQQACHALDRPSRVCPVHPDGTLDMDALEKMLDQDISVLAVTHCSNVLGTVTPLRELCDLAHARGARVLADGAQSVCHRTIDVAELGCDWFVCSGHKLGGPTGVGLLYSREPLPSVRFGGGMVDRVTAKATTFAPPPLAGEAGTPNVSGAAGLAAAIRYRQTLPSEWQAHERMLLARAETLLCAIPGVRVLGAAPREGCLSFTVEGVSPLDAALLMDEEGVAVRSGSHCAQPLMDALNVDYTLRISPAFYNTEAEIDSFIGALRRSLSLLRGTGS